MNPTARAAALARLGPFVGEWRMDAAVAAPSATPARTVFEWGLDGQFLVQRSHVPDPVVPDALCVIDVDAERGGYAQHYFDSRGVVRVYAMAFRDGLWTLLRTTPDFSPLTFWQRFTGTFSDAGDVIRGRWDVSHDHGAAWEPDFDLIYTKLV
jgi:hypothetical protein